MQDNQNSLKIYNTLSRNKEVFEPLVEGHVGMYVCGPTVYGDAHLGHARPAVTFDVVYRYLMHQGFKVRYVRNITDVGHLERDADEGEDKIAKKAKLEQLEPMEVVQNYTDSYHRDMAMLNTLRPSIEPTATGHIMEQIEMIQTIIDHGLAYVAEDGSVYFDVEKYNKEGHYGKLSGRKVEDLMSGTRELEGQQGKRNPLDFALWKKADEWHIMRWKSPWSEGFPGWHLECSAMSAKYLGKQFDIHGGGMDLQFPHHECEIAQTQAAFHNDPARYWMHNNLITINGQKMGKSLGNFITLQELFNGQHELLEQAYSPMTVRFFMLQAHYRSTLDFSNEALQGAHKAYKKAINGLRIAKKMTFQPEESIEQNKNAANSADMIKIKSEKKVSAQILQLCKNVYRSMNDDFNTALALGHLFNLLKKINSLHTGQLKFAEVGQEAFDRMKETYITFMEEIFGLVEEKPANPEEIVETLLEFYKDAKASKAYDKVDSIRASLKKQGIVVKDMKTGIEWAYEE
jgi:cysteinyl-tRNA synthetase